MTLNCKTKGLEVKSGGGGGGGGGGAKKTLCNGPGENRPQFAIVCAHIL